MLFFSGSVLSVDRGACVRPVGGPLGASNMAFITLVVSAKAFSVRGIFLTVLGR